MSESTSAADNLLTEHLTYRPITLIDDVINSINELSFKAINAIEKGLLTADPANIGFKIPANTPPDVANETLEKCKHEIENGVHQFETLFEAKIDKNFDILEIFALRNMLSVPEELRDWMRLSHYEGLNMVEYKDAPDVDAVLQQRRKYRETAKLHALLEAEKAKNEATLRSLRKLVLNQRAPGTKTEPDADVEMEGQNQSPLPGDYPTFAFLRNKGDLGSEGQPITTATSFALGQAGGLKSLLENVEPRLKELGEGSVETKDEKTFRRERLEFIEKETKRHLENVRGLELGEQGVVRDGEWQGEGRTLGKGEVESLERVVGIVGGATEGDPMDEGS